MTAHKNAFTLIEILIVIAILGILSAIAASAFQNAQVRARDTQRKSDLKQIAQALEIFYNDYERYPSASSGKIQACDYDTTPPNYNHGTCEWGDDSDIMQDDKGTVYFRELPKDPRAGSYYYRTNASGSFFQLYAHLENSEDTDCIDENCASPTLPTTNSPSCGGGANNCNFSVTSANVSPGDE